MCIRDSTQTSRQVDTNVGIQLLNDHQVKSAKIYDGDQRVELQLKDDYKKGNDNYGKSVRFYYVQPRGNEVAKAMESAELESYTDQPVEDVYKRQATAASSGRTGLLGVDLPGTVCDSSAIG